MNFRSFSILLWILFASSIVFTCIDIIPLKGESIIRTLPADDTGYEVDEVIDIYGIYDKAGEFGHIKECFLKDDILYITKFFLVEEFQDGNPDTFLPTLIARVKIIENDLYGYAFLVEPVELFRTSFHPDELGDYEPGDEIPIFVSPSVPTSSREIYVLMNAINSSLDEILALELNEIADDKTVELVNGYTITENYLNRIRTEIIGWDRGKNVIIMKSKGELIPTTQMNFQSLLVLYSIYDCENGKIDRIYITIQTTFLE
jgi:hypothetical protein